MELLSHAGMADHIALGGPSHLGLMTPGSAVFISNTSLQYIFVQIVQAALKTGSSENAAHRFTGNSPQMTIYPPGPVATLRKSNKLRI